MSFLPAWEAQAVCRAVLLSWMSECQGGKSDLTDQTLLFPDEGMRGLQW